MVSGETTDGRRPRGRPSEEQAALIGETVLATALALFCTHGFTAVTMERIATEAKVSKAALYRRFSGKSAILATLVERFVADVPARIARVPSTGDTALQRIRSVMRIYREQRHEPAQNDLHKLLVTAVQLDPALGGELDRARQIYVQPIDALIERAIADGEIVATRVDMFREILFDLLVNGVAYRELLGMAHGEDSFDVRWNVIVQVYAAGR